MVRNDSIKIDAVLFDLDGVLVDSAFYHFTSWQHVMLKLGVDIDETTVYQNEGRKAKELLEILIQDQDLNLSEYERDTIIAERRQWYKQNCMPVLYYNAFPVIQRLRDVGISTAIVTSSAREHVDFALNENLQAYFDLIVANQEGLKAKPSGEPYLYASTKLFANPNNCLVIENSPLGILSAKDAGMRCVAVETVLPKMYLQKADWIIRDISDLPELMNAEELW